MIVRARATSPIPALLALILALLLAATGRAHAAAPTFPALTGRVVDDAHVLSPETQNALAQKLADLETSTGRQLVVVTLSTLQGSDIQDYGYQLGRAWGIGQKGQNNGALFIVVPSERKVRIEVGYGLEPILTDALSNVILQERVLPKFRSGDVSAGIVDGTQALIDQLAMPDDAAKAKVAQAVAAPAPRHGGNPLGMVFTVLLVLWVLGAMFRGRRRGGGMGWLLPMMILNSGWGRGRGDDWSGGGDGGGGGFSGGGGSFGGGGSSGSW